MKFRLISLFNPKVFLILLSIEVFKVGINNANINAQSNDIIQHKFLKNIDPDRELSKSEYKNLFGHNVEPLVKIQKNTIVYCGIEIQDIRSIDPAKGTFSLRGFLWYYWDDKRFQFDENQNIESLKWAYNDLKDEIWIPSLDFDNSTDNLKRWGETIEIFPEGIVEYWCNFTGDFSDQNGLLDFQMFPCEKLPIAIDITSPYQKKNIDIKYCRETNAEDIIQELIKSKHPEYNYSKASVIESSRSYTSEWNREFSVLRLIVEANRHRGYYLFHIFLPVASLILVFLVGQRISKDMFEARIGLCLTCLLSLIAYTFSFSDSLPKLGYLTLMDLFITINYIIIALGTISTASKEWSKPGGPRIHKLMNTIDIFLPYFAVTIILIFAGFLLFL